MKAAQATPLSDSIFDRVRGSLTAIRIIFTLRGLALALFFSALIFGPVLKEQDIVAAVLGYSLLGVLLSLGLFTLTKGLTLRSNCALTLTPGGMVESDSAESSTELISQHDSVFILKLPALSISPLFGLRISIDFSEPGMKVPLQILFGYTAGPRLVPVVIRFPHRGIWSVSRIRATFGDQTGLTAFSWNVSTKDLSFRVSAPAAQADDYPIISSSHRSGESQIDTNEPQGDPFDLKRYNPADGSHRIVWKVYAKTGELISRHPEPSMTPEGRVIAFCYARSVDDLLCAKVVDYLGRLEAAQLSVSLGCNGMTSATGASSAEKAKSLLIETAWNAELSTANSTRDLAAQWLEGVRKSLAGGSIDRLLIFSSIHGLADQRGYDTMIALAELLEAGRISPIFFHHSALDLESTATEELGRGSSLKSIFVLPTSGTAPTTRSWEKKFLAVCVQRNWQVMLC